MTIRTGHTRVASCQVGTSIILTPSTDGSIALRWAKESGGGASGPALKKLSSTAAEQLWKPYQGS